MITLHSGDFVEDQMEGSGQYVYGNGDIYLGQFKAGKREGAGTYHYKVRQLLSFGHRCWVCSSTSQGLPVRNFIIMIMSMTGGRLPVDWRVGGRWFSPGPVDSQGA